METFFIILLAVVVVILFLLCRHYRRCCRYLSRQLAEKDAQIVKLQWEQLKTGSSGSDYQGH